MQAFITDSVLTQVNNGSSSLKYKLFAVCDGEHPINSPSDGMILLASGLVERIGDAANSRIITRVFGGDRPPEEDVADMAVQDHGEALQEVLRHLDDVFSEAAHTPGGIRHRMRAVGHRSVAERRPALHITRITAVWPAGCIH